MAARIIVDDLLYNQLGEIAQQQNKTTSELARQLLTEFVKTKTAKNNMTITFTPPKHITPRTIKLDTSHLRRIGAY